MNTKTVYTTVAVILVGAVLGMALYAVSSRKEPEAVNYGRYLTSTVTNTSVTVNTTTTEVVAAGANLQRLIIKNLTTGTAYCAFGTVATSSTGLVIESTVNATSTETERDIVDPNLLRKTMNCLSTVAGTFSILKY